METDQITKPLAILLYEHIQPGAQVADQLEELNYRIAIVSNPGELAGEVQEKMPLVVLADLRSNDGDVCAAISEMKEMDATRHVPVLAYSAGGGGEHEERARAAGADLVAGEKAMLSYLPEFLDQALELR